MKTFVLGLVGIIGVGIGGYYLFRETPEITVILLVIAAIFTGNHLAKM